VTTAVTTGAARESRGDHEANGGHARNDRIPGSKPAAEPLVGELAAGLGAHNLRT
jgi:hypothetical protein